MRIQEVARRAAVTADTLRFYEQHGLLGTRHVVREPNGYRCYTPAALTRLRLIKLGQRMGFSLAEIRAYIHRWESGSIGNAEKARIYEAQIRKVDEQLEELAQVRDYLCEKRAQLAACDQG
jgi:MerR family transcriptional regulator, copper efflux regulator